MTPDKSPPSCPRCGANGRALPSIRSVIEIDYLCGSNGYWQCDELSYQSDRCRVSELTTKLTAAEQQLAAAEQTIKHDAEEWAEVDDALEAAGIVMNVAGYRKPHVEAIEELAKQLAAAREEIAKLKLHIDANAKPHWMD